MKPNRTTTALLAGLALFGLASCQTRTTYEDPEGTEVLSTDFSYTDLMAIAQDMVDSFLGTNVWGEERPRIVMGGVVNRTDQHIDTQNVTDTIRTALIQSGKFTVLASDQGIAELEKELEYQQSGAVDQAAAVELGKQLGAEYVLYGRFTNLREKRGDVESVWYKFTLNAVNVQTRQIVWADEKILRKREEKSFLGW